MIEFEPLLTFIVASALLSIAPGPDNIFVLTQSAVHGRKTGVIITIGLCSGLLFHTTLVALGVAALLQTSAVAFTLLKIIGALYLLYLAYQAFTASKQLNIKASPIKLEALSSYRRGIIMNITNPKVSIFFLAFLPQFVSAESGHIVLQTLTLGAIFISVALTIFVAIAFMAGTIGNWFRQSPKTQSFLNKLAGLVFIGLALNLLISV